MPEGIGEQTAKPLHERYGFESEEKMAEAFESLKGDVTRFKGEARTAKELADKLNAYEMAEAKRKESEMSETQKLAAKLADVEKQIEARDALIAAKDRAILTERVFSSKLSGRTPEEAAVLRRLLASAVAGQTFADEAELAELLKPAESEYAALRATLGTGAGAGPGLSQSGGPFIGQPGGAVVKGLAGKSFADMVEGARNGILGKKG
jgi:5'-3' exonuclease